MPQRIHVSIESTPKKAFASAVDWPGWSRGAKTEELALESLAAYAARYAPVVKGLKPAFPKEVSVDDLDVVDRVEGGAGTEFGIPSLPTKPDERRTDAAAAYRLADIVAAAWSTFDRVAAAAPEELRKGPRGGGRDTSKVVAHVTESDRAYANSIGIKIGTPDPTDRKAVKAMREAVLEVLRAARDGSPLDDRRWPARYAAHRIAWHSLDHAWEIEDRSEPEPVD
jgi:hypothetical protein